MCKDKPSSKSRASIWVSHLQSDFIFYIMIVMNVFSVIKEDSFMATATMLRQKHASLEGVAPGATWAKGLMRPQGG